MVIFFLFFLWCGVFYFVGLVHYFKCKKRKMDAKQKADELGKTGKIFYDKGDIESIRFERDARKRSLELAVREKSGQGESAVFELAEKLYLWLMIVPE